MVYKMMKIIQRVSAIVTREEEIYLLSLWDKRMCGKPEMQAGILYFLVEVKGFFTVH